MSKAFLKLLFKLFPKLLTKVLEFLKVDPLAIRGNVRMVCHAADGTLKWDTGWFHNLIVNAGIVQMATLCGASGTPFSYIAVGTSSTAVSASQTALSAEITDTGLQRASATVSLVTTTVTNDTRRFVKVFTATGSKTVEEVGIFNASSGGTMLGRALTGTKSLTNTDTLTITYDVKFA